MKFKKIGLIMLFVISVFLLNTKMIKVLAVEEFPTNLGDIQQYGETTEENALKYNGMVSFFLKYYRDQNSNLIYTVCTQFSKKTPASWSPTCTPTNNWSYSEQVGVASIIKKLGTNISSITNDSLEKYYYAELAINEFLCYYNTKYDPNDANLVYNCIHEYNGDENGKHAIKPKIIEKLGQNYTMDDAVKLLLGSYYYWYSEAITASETANASITISADKLTFTKEGNYYVSNKFKVEKNVDNGTVSNVASGSADVEIIGNLEYRIKVDASKVSPGDTITFTVKGNKTVDIAQNYTCTSNLTTEPLQNLTPNVVKPSTTDASQTISGTIPKDTETIVSKKDASTSKELAGATLQILDKDKKTIDCTKLESDGKTKTNLKSCTWISSSVATKIVGLPAGKYYLKETIAPSGYVLKTETIEFTVKNDGTVNNVEMLNNLTEIVVSKKDVITNSQLSGVTLQILDKDKKAINCTKLESDGKTKTSLNGCTWVSGSVATKIVGLPAGKYYLKETKVPSGYVLKSEAIEFTVKNDGTVNNVEMLNNLTETVISKKDATTGKELAGATLQILDRDKKTINCTKLESDGKTKTSLNGCTWISSSVATKIVGLPAGKYYLKETIAPEGYILKESSVEFTVKNDGTINSVEMTNDFTKIKITKKSSSTGKLLSGVTLQLLDKDKKEISKCYVLKDGKKEELNKCTWETTNSAIEIVELPLGKYYLKEVNAPEGYAIETELKVIELSEKTSKVDVEMTNFLNKVVVKKINNVDGNLLPGATLQILDKDKKAIKCTIKIDNNEEKLDDCSWLTGETTAEIIGLPVGEYYLKEVNAPEGYVLNENLISFKIEKTDKNVEVEMGNDLEVDVPDTLSSRSTLLIAISMFDIALGIGIITYVKKNKIEE